MPIRFQVDPDFYDHPKVLDLSDAAVALWVRAGSYSAAKLTDGFVAENALGRLSKTPLEAAEELRRCGLWHKVKGGYRFHEWEVRNLTRKRVETDREADRKRKRNARGSASNSAGQNGTPQANPGNVRPESRQSPDGIQAESDRNPGVSVSVSVSESVSGSGRDPTGGHPPSGEPPPPRCPQHLNEEDPPNCGRCGDARRRHEAWQVAETERARQQKLLAESTAAKARAEAHRLEIDNCVRCDHEGKIGGYACRHEDPTVAARRAAQGRASITGLTRERASPIAQARRPDRSQTGLDQALADVITLHSTSDAEDPRPTDHSDEPASTSDREP